MACIQFDAHGLCGWWFVLYREKTLRPPVELHVRSLRATEDALSLHCFENPDMWFHRQDVVSPAVLCGTIKIGGGTHAGDGAPSNALSRAHMLEQIRAG